MHTGIQTTIRGAVSVARRVLGITAEPALGTLPRRLRPESAPGAPSTREGIVWGYRTLLGREPESEDMIRRWLETGGSFEKFRSELIASAEFRTKNPAAFSYTTQRNVVIKELDDGPRLFVDLSDVSIGLSIVQGSYERDEVAFVREHVREGDVVVDAGANIGFFTVLLAAFVGPAGRVFAYEPLPQNTALLERSIAENRFEDRVRLHKAVLSDRAGCAELVWLPLERGSLNSGGSYIRSAGAPVPPGHDVLPVPMVTLDAEEFPGPVRFMKIDVEGAEPLVLRGAREMLIRDRPVILAEVNPVQLAKVSNETPDGLLGILQALGYDGTLLWDGKLAGSVDSLPGDEIRTVVFLPTGAR